MLRPALAYAARGWPVFPCQPDKRPATPHGFKDASRDREKILTWWMRDPGAMIGAPTGAASGLAVLDLDTDPAKGVDGIEAFSAVVKTAGAPIRTRKHRTPRGGLHLFFRHPGEPVKNTAGEIAPGVDTRGDGGYVILPPSTTAAGCYTVETDTAPAPMPAWLAEMLRQYGIMARPEPATPPAARQSAPAPIPGMPRSAAALLAAGAPEGQRNTRALALAVQLRDEGHGRAAVEGLVLEFAGRCTPPLPEQEARAAVGSAFTRPPREPARDPTRQPEHRQPAFPVVATAPHEAPDPWEAPAPLGGMCEPPPPWPWPALPPALRDMGEAIMETFNTSNEMAAAAVLGVASIALSNKARVELKRDHRQFSNLFFLVAAGVASGKTPVTRAAQGPLVDWQRERREAWKLACDQWDARQKRVWAMIHGFEDEAKRLARGSTEGRDAAAIEREIARLRGELEDRPPEPILFCGDATSEALGRRMQERAGAIGVLSGEARKILSIAKGRYVEGGDIDLWLAGHAGDYLRVDRSAKDKPSYEIPEACLSALIMTQPDSLQSLGEAECLRESGFLARWLYLIPEHDRGAYPVESIPATVAGRYARTVRALIDLPRASLEDGTPAPHLVRLAPDAFDCWRAFHDSTVREIGETRETRPGSFLQWLSKLPEHVARLALLFHACQHAEGAPLGRIERNTIEDAILLAGVLAVHARRAFAIMGGDVETARARKVWSWLDRNRDKLRTWREKEGLPVEAVKPRELDRHGVAGVENVTEAEAVLMLLADKGYVQGVDIRPPTAGRPTRLFYLRPPDKIAKPDKIPPPPPILSGLSGLSGSPEAETPPERNQAGDILI
jgi:hypothetical protein